MSHQQSAQLVTGAPERVSAPGCSNPPHARPYLTLTGEAVNACLPTTSGDMQITYVH